MATVMIMGTFDLIHPGHINVFNQVRKYGDKIIIIVARDKTVTKVKGKPTLHNELERKRALEDFDHRFTVILGDLEDPYTGIRKYKPDVICLGYDQKIFVDKLKENLKKAGLKTKIIRLKPYKEKLYKSSILIKELKKLHEKK